MHDVCRRLSPAYSLYFPTHFPSLYFPAPPSSLFPNEIFKFLLVPPFFLACLTVITMGTRGLVFVRCRGRYFAYYNQFDSYPEGLGVAIVQQIPENYGEYSSKITGKMGFLLSISSCASPDMVFHRMAEMDERPIWTYLAVLRRAHSHCQCRLPP